MNYKHKWLFICHSAVTQGNFLLVRKWISVYCLSMTLLVLAGKQVSLGAPIELIASHLNFTELIRIDHKLNVFKKALHLPQYIISG